MLTVSRYTGFFFLQTSQGALMYLLQVADCESVIAGTVAFSCHFVPVVLT